MEAAGNKAPLKGERHLGPNDRIDDLVDVVEEGNIPAGRNGDEIIVIDGRVYQRVLQPGDTVYELTDVVEEGPRGDEVSRLVAEITERIAREIIPGIAERVIREEIEKLKE